MTFAGLTGSSLARARIYLIVAPAFLLYGYNQSSIGGVLDYPSFIKYFPPIDTTHTTGSVKTHNATIQGMFAHSYTVWSILTFLDVGTVVAIYTIGCLIGALGITQLGNRIGRRKSLIGAAALATIGLVIQATSYHIAQLVIGRIINGIGTGGVNAVIPVWQSECTRPKSRGKNVVVIGVFIASGVAIASWINVGLSFVKESEVSWRLPLALPIAFALLLMTFTMSFPESPRWLISKGFTAEARAAMLVLADGNITSYEAIDAEIETICRALRESSTSEYGFINFFRPGPQRLFNRLCLAIAINFGAQMTGSNLITYYGKIIFQETLGLEAEKAAIHSAGVLTWKIFAALSAYLSVDRFGRKPLFIISTLGMGASMAGLTVAVWAIDNRYTYGASIAATFLLFSYMFFFPLGFSAIHFLYAAEIAPQELRMHLAAIGTATHWLFTFVIAEITPVAFATIRWRYYIVYAVIAFLVAFMVYLIFPETKGRSLEEIDRLFEHPEHWWQVTAYAKEMGGINLGEVNGDDVKMDASHIEKA